MRILVVDDNRAFLDVIGGVLRDHGHDTIIAEDGKQAREALEFEAVDLIISDVFMPTLDGTRFHSYVREFTEWRDIPFIFISGYDDETTRRLVADSTKDFFFNKTVPFEEVLSLVGKIEESLKTDTAAR
jgi:CheY-like chemotaxis protein